MDYYQGVVTEYLRTDRAMFVNPECCIQLDPGDASAKGRYWFCDVVAINLREQAVYLCEVTYSMTMQALIARLQAWDRYWPLLRAALVRDCAVPDSWKVQPWLFILQERRVAIDKKLSEFVSKELIPDRMPYPKVTSLEDVAPWKYPNWGRELTTSEDGT